MEREESKDNYEYSLKELKDFPHATVKIIASKYKLDDNKSKTTMIRNILAHQKLLEDRSDDKKNVNIKNNIRIKTSSPVRSSKINTDDIINNITTIHPDAIRLLAYNLDYPSIVKLCRSNKRFNEIICSNNLFQKNYGLRYLTSHEDRLPQKEGKYEVLKELDKISKKDRGYLVEKGYDIYIKNLDLTQEEKDLFLRDASYFNYTDIAKYLVDEGADLNADYLFSTITPLMFAATNNNLELVKYLVKNGANIDVDNNSVIKDAAERGELELVKYLIENYDESEIENVIKIVSYSATSKGHLNIIKYLFENNFAADSFYESIIYAAYFGHFEIVKYMIKNGADINTRDLLSNAAMNGHLDVVKYLIENGADIHLDDDYALIKAAGRGDLNIIKYLVENGANLHAKNDLVLQITASYGDLETVKYLIEKASEASGTSLQDLRTLNDKALIIAAQNGHLKLVKYLVENDVNSKGALRTVSQRLRAMNNKALRYAASNGYLDVVKYLVNVGYSDNVGKKIISDFVESDNYIPKEVLQYLQQYIKIRS